MVSLPQLLERVTYALKAFKVPVGGFPISTITHSIVCPWDLKSVKAYAGVSASCRWVTVHLLFSPRWNLFCVGNMGSIPFGSI